MSFTMGQKVRIKGTDIEGIYQDEQGDGSLNVEHPDGVRYGDWYLPAELVEAVIEPITEAGK